MPIKPIDIAPITDELNTGRQRILIGDVLTRLRALPDESVQCVITSPPYWGLRNYGVDGQIGSEKTPDEFVAKMVEVFREVRRVLRKDGTLWLNLGDTYAATSRTGPQGKSGQRASRTFTAAGMPKNVPAGLKPKDLVGIPWRVAFALQADGWWLRQDIIWQKPNPMPSSVTDRCTTSHEYMFLLTKSDRYYFDAQAIAEPASCSEKESVRKTPSKFGGADKHAGYDKRTYSGREYQPVETRNKRDVWTISTQSYKGAHFATFPEMLVEPCLLAGTSEHGCCSKCGAPWGRVVERERIRTRPGKDSKAYDRTTGEAVDDDAEKPWRDRVEIGNRDPGRHVTKFTTKGWQPTCKCEGHQDAGFTIHPPNVTPCTVLDPFCGSGTTLTVAKHYGRHGIGIELNPEYANMAIDRIKAGCNRIGKKKR